MAEIRDNLIASIKELRREHCGGVAQASILANDEFVCRVVYIDYGKAIIKA